MIDPTATSLHGRCYRRLAFSAKNTGPGMTRIVFLLTTCATILLGLLLPQAFWVNESCCNTTITFQALSQECLCPMSHAHADGFDPCQIHFDAPSCCKTTEYSLTQATQVVILPKTLAVVGLDLVAPAWQSIATAVTMRPSARVAEFATDPDPPAFGYLFLRHSRLNL